MLEDKICGMFDVTNNTREADSQEARIQFPSGNALAYTIHENGFRNYVFTYQTRDGCFMP